MIKVVLETARGNGFEDMHTQITIDAKVELAYYVIDSVIGSGVGSIVV